MEGLQVSARQIELVRADGGAYASGTRIRAACTANALANLTGWSYRQCDKLIMREDKREGKHQGWRRAYHKAGLTPAHLDRVLGWLEVAELWGNCIVVCHTVLDKDPLHTCALVGGRMLDWRDSRPYAPKEVWVSGAVDSVSVGKADPALSAWQADFDRLFGVPIETHLERAKRRRK